MALIGGQITKGRELLNSPITENDYDSWELLTENYLKMVFGPDSDNVPRVLGHGRRYVVPFNKDEGWWENDRADRLKAMLSAMETMLVLLDAEAKLANPTLSAPTPPTTHSNRVFVVHGHDDAVIHQTARFLEKLELAPLVLREQPNEGRTVIEKFEDYSDVGFAVVLLTPDDVGGKPDSELLPRARQNVIFELGYFIAKLGRERVCALYLPGVEVPSDYPVLYVPFEGDWQMSLAKEMKAAGLNIDMNLAVE